MTQARPFPAVARTLNVPADVHPADHLFWWQHDDPERVDKLAVVRGYLTGGAEAAMALKQLIGQYRSVDARFTMLEFASGYGRVSRHWRNVLPCADVIACDVHAEAVEFLRRLGVPAALSSTVPEHFNLARKFDVIFALSFFTHMPRRTWGRWLRVLADRLAPSGLLVFTTHGLPSLKEMGVSALDPDGFWFASVSEQKDLDGADYGATATSLAYVMRQLRACHLDLRYFREAGMGHQDVYIATPRRNSGEIADASEPFADSSAIPCAPKAG
jgi:SAM-dependent methyltransferase